VLGLHVLDGVPSSNLSHSCLLHWLGIRKKTTIGSNLSTNNCNSIYLQEPSQENEALQINPWLIIKHSQWKEQT
jgi:hypothetical protein